MQYPDELEQRYSKGGYQSYEHPAYCGDYSITMDILSSLDITNRHNEFRNAGWVGDDIVFADFMYYSDNEDDLLKQFEQTQLALFVLPKDVEPFLDIVYYIKELPSYKADDILPKSFYEAIEYKRFKTIENDTYVNYTGLPEGIKTHADLPREFVEGIKSRKIIEPSEEGGIVIHSWADRYMPLPISFYKAVQYKAFKIKKNNSL